MIAITTKTHYATLALIDLFEYQQESDVVRIEDISRRRNVPRSYLVQIFNQLMKAGIVSSVRGNRGGYRLGATADQITVWRVAEVLEGSYERSNPHLPGTALDELLSQAQERFREVLSVPLPTLALRQRALDNQLVYHI